MPPKAVPKKHTVEANVCFATIKRTGIWARETSAPRLYAYDLVLLPRRRVVAPCNKELAPNFCKVGTTYGLSSATLRLSGALGIIIELSRHHLLRASVMWATMLPPTS